MNAAASTVTSTVTSTLTIALLLSCSALPQRTENRINRSVLASTQVSQHAEHVKAGDQHWLERGQRSRLDDALKQWEQAITLKDDDAQTYAKLARGYYFLADAHLSSTAMAGDYPFDTNNAADKQAAAEMLAAHLRGTELAERGLSAHSVDFEDRIKVGVAPEDAIEVLDATAIGLIYWYAANLGKWANAKGLGVALKHKDRIFKLATRVFELDPTYFFGAAHRYFGAYFAVAPSYAGGSIAKSGQHATSAIELGAVYLENYVLAAEFYAIAAKDEQAFDGYLNATIGAFEDPAEIRPENANAKRKAAALLAKRAQYFPAE